MVCQPIPLNIFYDIAIKVIVYFTF